MTATGLHPVVLVGAGGAVGAVIRHAVGVALHSEDFPFGTLVVNVIGSGVLAAVTVLGAGSDLSLFVGVGVCGAFTTFSGFAFETVRMWETGARLRAVANAVGTLVLAAGVAAVLTAAV